MHINSNISRARIVDSIIGDGVVSREELQQFVASSGMAELDDKEFDILFDSIDEDKNGELSFEEITDYLECLIVCI